MQSNSQKTLQFGDYPTTHDEALWYLGELLCLDPAKIAESEQLLADHGKNGVEAYTTFFVPKKSGGQREIKAPVSTLKTVCRRIYREMLLPIPLNHHIHGFRPRHSIYTNAKVHLVKGANFAVNFDITDCFPSTPIGRIYQVFEETSIRWLRMEGLSRRVVGEILDILAHLCTLRYGRASTEVLPMGSPTSPALLNLVLQEFDLKVCRIINKRAGNITYSRYGDDLTFSSPDPLPPEIKGLVKSLLGYQGYRLNPNKTRFMERGGSAKPIEVTGLILGNGRLLISDQVLQSYELKLARILRKEKMSKSDRQIVRGILGICKMVYDGKLPARLIGAIKQARAERGEETDQLIADIETEGDDQKPSDYEMIQALLSEAPDVWDESLDPTGQTDLFHHDEWMEF